MERTRKLFVCLLAVSWLASASCATTRLNSVWSDVSFRGGQIKSVVVVVIPAKEVSRRLLEVQFVGRLKDYGIEAIPSHVMIFSDEINKEMITEKAKEQDFDAVLAMRVVDRKTVEQYYPGYPGGKSYYAFPWDYHVWGDRYYQGFPANVAPKPTTYTASYRIFSIETDLYDIGAGRVIWSALSDTFAKETFEREIETFVSTIMTALDKDNILLSAR